MWFSSARSIMLITSLIAATLIANLAKGSPQRLSTILKDMSTSDRLYLKPGLAMVIEFPKPVVEVRVGNPNLVKVSISTVSPKELTLFAGSSSKGATNLVVRSDKKVHVFDVTLSQTRHQDFVKIQSTYGAPSFENSLTLIDSGRLSTESKNPAPRGRLIESAKLGVGK